MGINPLGSAVATGTTQQSVDAHQLQQQNVDFANGENKISKNKKKKLRKKQKRIQTLLDTQHRQIALLEKFVGIRHDRERKCQLEQY